MSLATLVQKLKSRKQVAERTTFQQYLATVRELASGEECDSDEVAIVLESADKNEDDLSRDVNLQQQRLAWHAQRVQNQQAVSDRLQAENELQAAQRALQSAYDKLQPAIDQAHDRLNAANHRFMTTTQAESWLAGNVLDHELIEREQAVIAQLKIVSDELRPLLIDLQHKQSWLMSDEFSLAQKRGRDGKDWPAFGGIVPFFNRNVDMVEAEKRVADSRSQLAQLEQAIRPRQIEQSRLQAELNQIHQEKLKP